LGTIIEFDKNIREPLVLEVGNVKLARGSIVKIGEKFGFQVVDFVL
jgi:flagellar motor switch/type III secretory pathway protein FliN